MTNNNEDVPFVPLGGFPPLYRKDDKKPTEKTLESRGFVSTNIVSISNIMSSKKKENLFNAFGSEDEDGVNLTINGLYETPYDFDEIDETKLKSKDKGKNKNKNKTKGKNKGKAKSKSSN